MSISTHVLDTMKGRPAVGVAVILSVQRGDGWHTLHAALTDEDGRVKHLLPELSAMEAGIYRVRFETKHYFAAEAVDTLYPFIEITFNVDDGQGHYHIPLLLTANGYTTYRGS